MTRCTCGSSDSRAACCCDICSADDLLNVRCELIGVVHKDFFQNIPHGVDRTVAVTTTSEETLLCD